MQKRLYIGIIGILALVVFEGAVFYWVKIMWNEFWTIVAAEALIGGGGLIVWMFKRNIMSFVGRKPQPETTHDIEAYEPSELVVKYPWVSLLPQAKQEIVALAVACESISHRSDLLRELLEANEDLSITCVLVDGRTARKAEKDMEWTGLTKSVEASIERLKAAKERMTEKERKRFGIEVYETPPPFNMVVLDHQSENAYMQVGYYLIGIDQNYRITNVFRKKGREKLFRKYWDEYQNYFNTNSSISM